MREDFRPIAALGVKSDAAQDDQRQTFSRDLTAFTMRLSLRMSRPIDTLDEVQTVLKYFEGYGRVQAFSIRRVTLQILLL